MMFTAWALNHAALTKVIREGETETERQAGREERKKGWETKEREKRR